MCPMPDPVKIATDLICLDTINPPGGEEAAARYLGDLLAQRGLATEYYQLEPHRSGLVATLAGTGGRPALVFTGHLDTVPLGNAAWSFGPHCGEVKDGRLLGRGASDMKSGVAAMAAAAAALAEEWAGEADLVFVFTAAEETGCQGAEQMAAGGKLPAQAGALLVAEPTNNVPFLGHKGALWLEATARGKSAHGSMPDMGDNAIYKAARAAAGLEQLFAEAPAHTQLGKPTVNVGTFHGGSKINMVPDQAVFQVDLRTVPGVEHDELFARVAGQLGPDIALERLIDLPGFLTPAEEPWAARVLALLEREQGRPPQPGYVNYFTDASVLRPALGNPPTVILGPGLPGQAHQTNEFCETAKIVEAAGLYLALAREWQGR
ncbi:peptidase M20 [Desulfoferula mesophila]|uniref:Peptidase M20 n=2 Tax=Desulfoferula mesophila TaxID=3058419 RepID=A0AAU9EW38_9BACT|nr:peptidase M20 [Desulfoferula mesophilus]